jgi:hypothetical protein
MHGPLNVKETSKFCYSLQTKRYGELHRDDSLNHGSDEKGEQNML